MTCSSCHGSGWLEGRQNSRTGQTFRYLLGFRACPCGLVWRGQAAAALPEHVSRVDKRA